MATSNPTPRVGSSKNAPSGPQTEKTAVLVMATNNSSIVSKRSVERLYSPKPHFFQHFVHKPHRRSPTINRGYWLRMQAIDRVVGDFLRRPTVKKKVIVNLGCGYDPSPFQWLAKKPVLCRDVRFVDVDHHALMTTKTKIIHHTPELSKLVKVRQVSETGILVAGEQYCGIACDLADLRRLDSLTRSVEGLTDAVILCIAEVSITYMDADAADALLAWSRQLSEDVTFGLLEQFLPDGPDHPFAKMMLAHFDKLRTPLRSIYRHPDGNSQCQRFRSAGWNTLHFISLWELWSDPQFLDSFQRIKLDQVEPFDEWEEFALFAAHYFLLVAHTSHPSSQIIECSHEDTEPAITTKSLNLKSIEIRHSQGLRLHGTVLRCSANAGDQRATIACIGGMTTRGRTSDVAIYTPTACGGGPWSLPPPASRTRQSHTISQLKDGYSVLVGGRASPAAAMRDCYLEKDSSWGRIQDLPSPRFRHSVAEVVLPGSLSGLLVFGGKAGPDRIQGSTILWDRNNGWRVVKIIGEDVLPRFGATSVALGDDFGLLFGGMGVDGVILQDFWKWKLSFIDHQTVGISLSSCRLSGEIDARRSCARFGASTVLFDNQLLVIGGIASSGYVPQEYEILSLDVQSLSGARGDADLTISISRVRVVQEANVARPMLVGHTTSSCADGGTLVIGGGAVCFSFGTHWNTHLYFLYNPAVSMCPEWTFADAEQNLNAGMEENEQIIPKANGQDEETLNVGIIKRVAFESVQPSISLIEQSQPIVLEQVDLGPCRTHWTPSYLTSKIGSERSVVIHQAHGRSMNFQRKDFHYATKPFGVFLDEISRGGHQYLRSISSSDPTKRSANLELDFPEIAADFSLPPDLWRSLADRFHSSPLRITGDVAMWLHVDTMANILCQISGSKRLILFPPTDMVKLDFPPGATTSNLEIFRQGSADNVLSIPGTHPSEAILAPGDVLFIPPLWAHTAAAPAERGSDGISMAVNVFFRNLPPQAYAAGKDVYGNRDLAAYENGRRGVANIVKAFDGLPPDLARAYLLRLADELTAKASGL